MSLSDIFDPVARAYFRNNYNGNVTPTEKIVVTSDCTNGTEAVAMFNQAVGENDKIVLFLLDAWDSYPGRDGLTENACLMFCWLAPEYQSVQKEVFYIRIRNGLYNASTLATSEYDFGINAGDIYTKVVLK